MTKEPIHRRAAIEWAVGITVLTLALFFLFSLFPVTGDDWFREALGRTIHSAGDLIREVAYRWSTNNSRILGNVLAYSSGSRPVLREALRASITLGVILLGAKCSGLFSLRGVFLMTACVLALPRAMFAQIYPWAAGFFNYVPPVMLLLACFALMQGILEGTAAGSAPGGRRRCSCWAFPHSFLLNTPPSARSVQASFCRSGIASGIKNSLRRSMRSLSERCWARRCCLPPRLTAASR